VASRLLEPTLPLEHPREHAVAPEVVRLEGDRSAQVSLGLVESTLLQAQDTEVELDEGVAGVDRLCAGEQPLRSLEIAIVQQDASEVRVGGGSEGRRVEQRSAAPVRASASPAKGRSSGTSGKRKRAATRKSATPSA
jgi:hypothetical protein